MTSKFSYFLEVSVKKRVPLPTPGDDDDDDDDDDDEVKKVLYSECSVTIRIK